MASGHGAERACRAPGAAAPRGETMSTATQASERLSFREKLSRLKVRMSNAEWRRYGLLVLAGKAMGIAAVIGVVILGPAVVRSVWDTVSGTAVHAQASAAAPDPYKAMTPGDFVNP